MTLTAEAAPITVELELEVGRMVAAMLGFNPKRAWAHITSGGTVANLEALWVARTVQFTPLMVQEFCRAHSLPLRIQHLQALRSRYDAAYARCRAACHCCGVLHGSRLRGCGCPEPRPARR